MPEPDHVDTTAVTAGRGSIGRSLAPILYPSTTYTVDEVAPFPPGYEPDPDVVTAELTLQPGPKDVVIAEAFVNRALYRLIVITCNTTTEELVDSTVTLGGDTRETVKPGELGGIDQNALCTLPGANYDNLTRGDYSPNVELPDRPPLFP